MVILTVVYPGSDASRLDHAYYVNKHMPLVRDRWTGKGLSGVQLVRGTAALDGSAPAFELIVLLTFASREELSAALEAHGAEIMGDVPNFTNIEPAIQISEGV